MDASEHVSNYIDFFTRIYLWVMINFHRNNWSWGLKKQNKAIVSMMTYIFFIYFRGGNSNSATTHVKTAVKLSTALYCEKNVIKKFTGLELRAFIIVQKRAFFLHFVKPGNVSFARWELIVNLDKYKMWPHFWIKRLNAEKYFLTNMLV